MARSRKPHLEFVLRWACCILILAGLSACGQLYNQQQVDELETEWRERHRELEDQNLRKDVELAELRQQMAGLEVQVQHTRSQTAREASERIDRRFDELQTALMDLSAMRAGDLEYVVGPDGPIVRIKDRVLFASGSHEVTDNGRALLRDLVPELARLGHALRVEGHTDSDRLRVHAEDYPRGNLELSLDRALEVASILMEAGFPEERVAVMGYGPWRPILPNDSVAAKARNRRVEIAILSRQARTED